MSLWISKAYHSIFWFVDILKRAWCSNHMLHRLVLCSFFILLFCAANAQKDSIESQIENDGLKAYSSYHEGDYYTAIQLCNQLIKYFDNKVSDSVSTYQALLFRSKNKIGDPLVYDEIANYYKTKHFQQSSAYLKYEINTYELEYLINNRQVDEALLLSKDLIAGYKTLSKPKPELYSNVLKMTSFIYMTQSNEDSVLYYNTLNLEHIRSNFPENHVEFGFANYNMANYFSNKTDFSKSIEYFDKAEEILRLNLEENHPNLGILSYSFAGALQEIGRYDESLEKYQKAIDIFKNKDLEVNLVYVYNNMATLENKLGRYTNAKAYIDEAIRLSKRNQIFQYPINVYLLQGLSTYEFNHRQDFNKARDYIEQILAIIKENDPTAYPDLAHNYFTCALISNEIGNIEVAEYYLNEASRNYEIVGDTQSANYLNLVFEYGRLYFNKEDFSKALSQFSLALEKYSLAYGKDNPYVSDTYDYLIQCYRELGMLDQADSLLISGTDPYLKAEYNQAPFIPSEILSLISQRMALLLTDNLDKAKFIDVFNQIDNLGMNAPFKRSMVFHRLDLEKHLFLSNQINSSLLRKAVEVFDESEDGALLDYIFELCNRLKSNIINYKVDEDKLLIAADIPSHLTEEYQNLRNRARFIELKTSESDSIDIFNKEKTELNNDFQKWYNEFRTIKDHNIGALKGDFYTGESKALLEYLCEQNKSILYYYEYDGFYRGLVINCSGVEDYQLEEVIKVDSLIDLYNQKIEVLAKVKELKPISDQIYNSIFLPFNESLKEEVLLIKAGRINLLNPETLLINDPDNLDDSKWLINKYKFYYFDQIPKFHKEKVKLNSNSLLVFAPGFINEEPSNNLSHVLGATPWTIEFAKKLSAKYEARLLDGETATVASWNKNKDDYQTIHFGTHAILSLNDPTESKLMLSDSSINFNDIIKLNLSKIKTVVLAACETGLGSDYNPNEIYSLNLAFQYAGVKQLVYSLWKIDDESTNQLLEQFYDLYYNNFGIADALWSAKIDYLSKSKRSSLHPYYWGGISTVQQYLIQNNKRSNWIWVGSLVLIMLVFYSIYKYSLKN